MKTGSEVSNILNDVGDEIKRSEKHGARFSSLHQAYAVIAEEMDEVWEITKMKRRNRVRGQLRNELLQVAAMAVKAIQSLDNFVGGDV